MRFSRSFPAAAAHLALPAHKPRYTCLIAFRVDHCLLAPIHVMPWTLDKTRHRTRIAKPLRRSKPICCIVRPTPLFRAGLRRRCCKLHDLLRTHALLKLAYIPLVSWLAWCTKKILKHQIGINVPPPFFCASRSMLRPQVGVWCVLRQTRSDHAVTVGGPPD